MRISQGRLIAEFEATGFQPEFLEKTFHLLALLNAIDSHPFLKGKLALKGGTALNLFVFCEPKGGKRHIEVTQRRATVDFAEQMK